MLQVIWILREVNMGRKSVIWRIKFLFKTSSLTHVRDTLPKQRSAAKKKKEEMKVLWPHLRNETNSSR